MIYYNSQGTVFRHIHRVRYGYSRQLLVFLSIVTSKAAADSHKDLRFINLVITVITGLSILTLNELIGVVGIDWENSVKWN